MNAHLHIVVDAGQVETLADALVGILQVVFAHQSHMYLALGIALLVEEVVPRLHRWRLANRNANLAKDGCVESLFLHTHRHLVDAGHVLALHHTLQVDITEGGHLQAYRVAEVAFSTEYEDIGLDTHALQFLHGVLGGFGL